MSDISGPGRPARDVRSLPLLLLVLAAAHALAAAVGLAPQGAGVISVVVDAVVAAAIVAAVVALATVQRGGGPLVLDPRAVQACTVAAVCLAGLASGVRAGEAGMPWIGADVALAVLVACALPGPGAFVTAVAGAEVSWGAVVLLRAASGHGRMAAGQWVLLATFALGVIGVAAQLRSGQRRVVAELEAARRSANQQAVTDALTGVTNRRGLELMALPMIEHARRQGEAAHCLFIDLDGFRTVNETLGRSSGDEVLAAVCEAVLASVRATDVVARWAGDQFVVIGPGTGTSPLEMERRVRGHLTERPPVPQEVWDARVSIGSATLVPWDEGNVDSLLRRAEDDMQLRRSLRRQSRVRSLGAFGSEEPPLRIERRSHPPKTPPASPTVPNDL